MICLTGDVHHSLNSSDQRYINMSEAEIARDYAEIAQGYGVKVTLFITGKAFIEDWPHMKGLLEFENVEIGGHTWSAFRPRVLHLAFRLLSGSYYGPSFYQRRDITKTLEVIKEKTGEYPVSWRTHAYAADARTSTILEKCGIRVASDRVDRQSLFPCRVGKNLLSLPINVMPDHEHLYHGYRTPKVVARQKFADSFSDRSYYINEWFEIIRKQIIDIENKKGIATLLVHPICMKVSDDFKVFEQLCRFLSAYETILAKDILELKMKEAQKS